MSILKLFASSVAFRGVFFVLRYTKNESLPYSRISWPKLVVLDAFCMTRNEHAVDVLAISSVYML